MQVKEHHDSDMRREEDQQGHKTTFKTCTTQSKHKG